MPLPVPPLLPPPGVGPQVVVELGLGPGKLGGVVQAALANARLELLPEKGILNTVKFEACVSMYIEGL